MIMPDNRNDATAAGASESHPPLRFVVLHHTGVAEPHYDVMVETSPGLLLSTWRAPNWPPRDGDVWTRLEDHRRAYLDYEGPISGGRGEVRRVAAGERWIEGDLLVCGDVRVRLAVQSGFASCRIMRA